jgi:hypothetical protein
MTTQGKDYASTSPKCHATVNNILSSILTARSKMTRMWGEVEDDDDDDR